MKKKYSIIHTVISILLILLVASGCSTAAPVDTPDANLTNLETPESAVTDTVSLSLSDIPEYSGTAYVAINNNLPSFKDGELVTESYETYSELDSLGRCSTTMACIGRDIMPTEDRGSIGQIKPTGWHTVKYDFIDGNYLYNRCHLIGYQLTGENANVCNLITGTRYMNVDGMLPFEDMVSDYVKETGNHVMYRVTPIFDGDNLVANGVQMEAYSVEDNGDGICFNIFCYNVQPNININYADGTSKLINSTSTENDTDTSSDSQNIENTTSNESKEASHQTVPSDTQSETTENGMFILNTNTKKIHKPDCRYINKMSESNKQEYTGNLSDLTGYDKCKACF